MTGITSYNFVAKFCSHFEGKIEGELNILGWHDGTSKIHQIISQEGILTEFLVKERINFGKMIVSQEFFPFVVVYNSII